MRRPEPWYWTARKGWYIQVNKKQEKLGDDENPKTDKAGKPVPPPEVTREYHRLMSTNNLVSEVDRRKALLPEVCEAYLSVKSKTRPANVKLITINLRAFCKPNLRRQFSSIRVADVEQVAESKPWAPGTKHTFVGKVMSLFKWAREAGYIEYNPFAGYENPYPKVSRQRCMTDEEYRTLVDIAKDIEFKRLMSFLRGTGCRPGEARIVTAKHLHPTHPIVTLEPHEHKTGRRSGKNRTLIMPSDVNDMMRMLAKLYPSGPLLRNKCGDAWKATAINERFVRYRRRLGWGNDMVPYTIRHAAATRWVEDGGNPALAAKMLGHSPGSATLMTTYYHPDLEKMKAAADKGFRPKA